jgi:putative tricarboxylic transport membrane protein
MVKNAPELLFAAIAGLLAATIFLVLTGWGMARLMLKAVQLDRQVVIVLAIAMTLVGIYAINTKVFDLFVAIGAGGVGYFMLRYGYSPATAALGVFIGKEFERSLRIGLNMNDNSWATFLSRPITAVILSVAVGVLVWGVWKRMQMRRRIAARTLEQGSQG